MIGIPLVTGCYLAVNVAYLTVLSPAELVASSAVAVVRSRLREAKKIAENVAHKRK